MKTVGDFKKAGVVFVGEDRYVSRHSPTKTEMLEDLYAGYINDDYVTHKHWCNTKIRSFAWRDLTTKPDNPQYKIELDIANHCWRPSLNQSVEYPCEQRVVFHDEYMEYLENARKDGITKPMTRSEYSKYLTGVPASAVAVNPASSEFKVGDLVVADCDAAGKYLIEIKYLDSHSVFGYLQSNDGQPPTLNHFCAYISNTKITHYNPQLNELKDIIGLHDDPTECAKAILAAGYTK